MGVHVHVYYYYSLVFLFDKLIYLLNLLNYSDLPSFAVEVMATPSASTDVLG